jgi:protein-disulfide isomerase
MNLSIPVGPSDHSLGPLEAPVTLVEYGDYECPYCADAHSLIKSILQAMGPMLLFVFRNMPFNEVHPYAQFAAEAAEAAGAQGKFWDMHDAIYEHQSEFGSALVNKLARRLKLDMTRFDADMQARQFRTRVKNDFMGGMRSGVASTPAFFINGKRYEGSVDERSLLLILQRQVPKP